MTMNAMCIPFPVQIGNVILSTLAEQYQQWSEEGDNNQSLQDIVSMSPKKMLTKLTKSYKLHTEIKYNTILQKGSINTWWCGIQLKASVAIYCI